MGRGSRSQNGPEAENHSPARWWSGLTPTSSRRRDPWPSNAPYRRATVILIVAGSLVCAASLWRLIEILRTGLSSPTTFDDAYAFCRYADHLLQGHGLAWNPGGPQTFGCTSLLYVLMIAVLKALVHLSNPSALAVGSWLPALAAVGLMGWTCARTATMGVLRHPIVATAFVCTATCLQPGFRYHAGTGMDTSTAILTNALLVHVVLTTGSRASWARLLLIAVVSYLSYLARPDNLLYAAIFPLLAILLRPSFASRSWQRSLIFAAFFGGLVAADTIVKKLVFGDPLPLAFYAKGAGFYLGYAAAGQWNPIRYLQSFLIDLTGPLLILLVTVHRRSLRLVLTCLAPCAATFCCLMTVTQIMGYQARFYYPALPFLVICAYAALDLGIEKVSMGRLRLSLRTVAGRLVLAGGVAVVVFPVAGRAASLHERQSQRRQQNLPTRGFYTPNRSAPRLGWWKGIQAMARFVQSCPPQAVWAMSEHGFISATAPEVTIIDLVGLHDRHTLSGKLSVDHVFDRRPEVIWFPHTHYTGLVNALLTSDRLERDYDFWPGAFDYGLAVRRQSSFQEAIRTALQAAWLEYYRRPCPPPSVPTGDPTPWIRPG